MSEPDLLQPSAGIESIAVLREDAPESPATRALVAARPLFLLALPCSHAGLVCAMLGRHPEIYDVPETHLFKAPTIRAWWAMCEKSTFHIADGLLRAVAEITIGDQTEVSILVAEGWLRRRSQLSTGLVYELLADKVSPRILVQSSTTIVSWPLALKRLLHMFPAARFLHLVQHPRGFGEFLMNGIRETSAQGPVPYWMLNLASLPGPEVSEDGTPHLGAGFDPQRAWYVLNTNILAFLDRIPDSHKLLVHVEDVFAYPVPALARIATWLGLRTDEHVIDDMQHPERSPYARFGPDRARYGNESAFLRNPHFHQAQAEPLSLEGPLSWRGEKEGFLPKVKELAVKLGYD